jgi:hypothetical protein
MTALLNWRVWAVLSLAVMLAASHWKAYTQGEKAMQSTFEAYKAEQVAQALEADQAVRIKEVALNQSLRSLTDAYIAEKNAHIAAAGRADDSLRQLQATLGSAATLDPATAIGADDLTRTRVVVGQCAATLAKVAEAADSLEDRLTGLQTYVKEVCRPGIP